MPVRASVIALIIVMPALLGGCSTGMISRVAAGDPTNDNLIAIADTSLANGDTTTALGLYRRIATAPGEHPEALTRYGQVLLDSGQYDYAAGAFAEALARQPRNVDARRGLGIAQLAQNQLEDAQTNLEQAVRDNADIRAVQDLAVLRIFQNQPDEARAIYQKALVRWPETLDLKSNFALFQALVGECDPAVGMAHGAASSPFARAQHISGYALVLAVCGRDDEAKEAARRVMSDAGVDRLEQQATAAREVDGLAAKATAIGVIPASAAAAPSKGP
jgi:tetratricopeptide (TPR) repeat protein